MPEHTARNRHASRNLRAIAGLLAAAAVLASCGAPVGEAPSMKGTYWEHALVTHPNGDGPQVVRWGPPQNFNPSGRN